MDKRFSIKDLVLFVMIGALILVVLLAMKQYDRQWELIKDIQKDSARNLNAIANKLSGLRAGVQASPRVVDPKKDPFAYVRIAREKPDFTEGDHYTRGITNIEKITPLTSADLYATFVQGNVLETLATRNLRTLAWTPLLAQSWTRSADGLAITFVIRPEATFSDSQRVTPDDVIFTFNLIMNPKIDAPRQRAYYQKIDRVEKTGEDAVTFRFKEPYFKSFDIAASMLIMSKSFYSKFSPEEFNKNPGLLFGSGPYRMPDPTSWAPGKPLKLVRNDAYWGVAPGLESIIFKEFSNDVAKIADFRNGGTDGLTSLFPDEYEQLLKEPKVVARSQHFEYPSPIAGYRYIGWNEQRKGKPTVFADKRVRRAMTLLTDRRWIADDLSLGHATVISGPFLPTMRQCDPAIAPWPFDPAAARALLKEAGFQDDGNGNLKTPDGQPFKFQLTYPSGNQTYQQMVLFLKDSYAKAGIILEPDPLSFSVLGQKMKNRDLDAIALGWSSNIEIDLYQAFHSDQMKDGGDDFISYSNAELDKLIIEARKTVDEDKRMELWHKAHRILHEDQPYTFLIARKYLDFYDARYKNLQVTPMGMNDQTEWFVPTADQKQAQ